MWIIKVWYGKCLLQNNSNRFLVDKEGMDEEKSFWRGENIKITIVFVVADESNIKINGLFHNYQNKEYLIVLQILLIGNTYIFLKI